MISFGSSYRRVEECTRPIIVSNPDFQAPKDFVEWTAAACTVVSTTSNMTHALPTSAALPPPLLPPTHLPAQAWQAG